MMQAIADGDVSRGSYKLVDGAISGDAGRGGYKKNLDDGDDVLEYSLREKALVRKIDRRIMPCLFAMIVLKYDSGLCMDKSLMINSYLDRNGLANARVQGIEQSLGLKGADFSTAISILFVGYITLQIPSNLLLTRVRPSLYLVNPLDLLEKAWLTFAAGMHDCLGYHIWPERLRNGLSRIDHPSISFGHC
jgi:hypothetical protein